MTTVRFCFVMLPIEYFSPVSGGAIATVTVHVARELEALGHEVFVLAPEDSQPVYSVGKVECIHLQSFGGLRRIASQIEARLRGWDHIDQGRYWKAVGEKLQKIRPDVVVLANDLMGALKVRRILPCVKIVGWLHNECRIRKGVRASLRATDAFLTCSHYIREWFLKEYSADLSRVHTAHAGVDREAFHPTEASDGGTLRLLYVGRLDPNKGVDVAVEAVRRMRERSLDVSLTVVGSAWFYNRTDPGAHAFVKKLKNSMGEASVKWLGHVPRNWLPSVVREHDVALVLSRSNEPFGLVVLEAMASGLAVVASPHGGLSEACGEAALLNAPDDVEGLIQKLEELSNDRSRLMELKLRSIRRASRACWGDTADVLLSAVGAAGDNRREITNVCEAAR